jgi:membrane protease YdiL (CAAX protease family)
MMIVMILPFVSWLMEINESLKLPEFLSGMEQWMRESEEQALKLTEAFLSDTSIKGLVVNMLMIGILASIGEELLFRGIILRIFKEWTKNAHLAVWISAILFSALHMQFYGFLPRMILGVVLGYLFVWSGSLWVPIITHFINNGSAVFIAYLYNKGKIQTDVESFGTTDNVGLIVGSIVVTVFFLVIIYRYEKNLRSAGIFK